MCGIIFIIEKYTRPSPGRVGKITALNAGDSLLFSREILYDFPVSDEDFDELKKEVATPMQTPISLSTFAQAASTISRRGPDATNIKQFKHLDTIISMCFHRLSIMDPSSLGMQPFEYNESILIANGEIYNHAQIQHLLDYVPTSKSDCEIILPLFHKLKKNLVDLCHKLDGEYAFVIFDKQESKIHIATDELSIRPLFMAFVNDTFVGVASEAKALQFLGPKCKITRLPPSTCITIDGQTLKIAKQTIYFDWQPPTIVRTYEQTRQLLYTAFCHSVQQKLAAHREVGFLLSGGLDSSLVCAEATKQLRLTNPAAKIRTFVIGFEGPDIPSDVEAAAKVANAIGSDHTIIWLDPKQAIAKLPDIAVQLETWDMTTIRASVPMGLGLLEIKRLHPDIAVIFSGELSDELFQGYLYNHRCPDPEAGRADTIQRLKEVHQFDALRFDRMTALASCEGRLPFFNKQILQLILESPPAYFTPGMAISTTGRKIEKFILRDAAANDPACLLPTEIIWRTKEALSDATSHKSSWKEQIKQEYPDEQEHYYRIFTSNYPYQTHLIPRMWLPSWSPDVTDPSATTLPEFQKIITGTI